MFRHLARHALAAALALATGIAPATADMRGGYAPQQQFGVHVYGMNGHYAGQAPQHRQQHRQRGGYYGGVGVAPRHNGFDDRITVPPPRHGFDDRVTVVPPPLRRGAGSYGRGRPASALPRRCYREYHTFGGGEVPLFSRVCLRQYYPAHGSLPHHCYTEIWLATGEQRRGWQAECLSRAGYALGRH